ncbi:HEAT repeat domain-containing protein [Nocardia camponoti]|uniref:MerR family transcriptional regulator n=1 Tax=Nocardia camponoti TaxID=1616106 RepID=A0A917Q831_9NOCA|nr:HEAT repeat domain-containing protein [Nocardia camponoti]GGK35226.1 MerR family transcriptional regulator [Nocardia camponoti]
MLIGDVAERTGVSARMLRHYDSLGLVVPTGRTVGGYREYAPADLRRIFYVEGLRSLGLSLRQVGAALADASFTPAGLVGELIVETQRRLEADRELLARLRAVDTAAPASWEEVADVVGLLRGLASPDAGRRQRTVLTESVPADALVEAVLAEDVPNVAGALRWALARAGDDAVPGLVAALSSDDVVLRRRAVDALVSLPGVESTAGLVVALDDSDEVVRRRAVLALGARNDVYVVGELVAIVRDGPNDVEAAELLGALASGAEGDRIRAALAVELAAPAADSAQRIRLTQALAEIPGTGSMLTELVDDDDEAVARIASALIL